MQLTLLELRDTPRFREASRVLYGPVGPELLRIAEEILLPTAGRGDLTGEGAPEGSVDCAELSAMARAMIEDYRAEGAAFDASVEVRDDIPAGMMVSGPRLLIGRSTVMARRRVEALLSHEVGVHLFTYFSGDLQGLRVFRSGLAGYEGVQEGLAVFAEYLVGGLTLGRLRLIAARAVGCAAMLDGADFVETFRLLHRDRGFAAAGAFGIALRLHRSGGLAKDAIYLRGLLEVLDHLRRKGSLDPLLDRQVLDRASADDAGARRARSASPSAGPSGVPVSSRRPPGASKRRGPAFRRSPWWRGKEEDAHRLLRELRAGRGRPLHDDPARPRGVGARPRHLLPDPGRLRAARGRYAACPSSDASRTRLQEGRDPPQGAPGRPDADRDDRRARNRRADAAQRPVARSSAPDPGPRMRGPCSAAWRSRAACWS